jgi:putative DNA primase/helicase
MNPSYVRPKPFSEQESQVNSAQDPDQLFNELLEKFSRAVCTCQDLQSLDIPPREFLVGRWMREGDLGFVYGERGSGKTWFVDAIAVHLSAGRELSGWKVSKALDVLLIDGEMPLDAARDRLAGMARDNARLHVLHHEMLADKSGATINLANEPTQRVITEICVQRSIKLLILDNLSCLFSGVKENEADEWEKVLNWLLDLRRKRIAALMVHHASRSGTMRGTSRREDAAFWVIRVEEKERQESERGAAFETVFTKQRNSDTREWTRKWTFKTETDGTISIGCEEISFDEKVFQIIDAGVGSTGEIANELGVAKSTVSKAAKRLERQNLINIRGNTRSAHYEPRGAMNMQTPQKLE